MYFPFFAQLEEGTPFARWSGQGKLSFPKDDDAADMYAEAVALLTAAGYEHYEVGSGFGYEAGCGNDTLLKNPIPAFCFPGSSSVLLQSCLSRSEFASRSRSRFKRLPASLPPPGQQLRQAGPPMPPQPGLLVWRPVLRLRPGRGVVPRGCQVQPSG